MANKHTPPSMRSVRWASSEMQRRADAVVLLARNPRVYAAFEPKGSLPPCPDEPFASNYGIVAEGESCTAFFVAPRILLTAGHALARHGCGRAPRHGREIESPELHDWTLVRGFTDPRRLPLPDPGARLVLCAGQAGTGAVDDWAVLELARGEPARVVLELDPTPRAEGFEYDVVEALGHPCGLALQWSPGASGCILGGRLRTTLHAMVSSSGSPVFDGRGCVVGIQDELYAEAPPFERREEPCPCWRAVEPRAGVPARLGATRATPIGNIFEEHIRRYTHSG